MSSPILRLVTSSVLLSAWLFLLLVGHTFGGAVYLLLVASLVLFPWKAARS